MRRKLLQEGSLTACKRTEGESMTNILEYLERSAEKYPEKTAFADPENQISYSELQKTAKKIGTSLAGFIEPGQPVPVFMGKSVETIEAFMGIVYAGCFYSLVDIKQPEPRIRQILATLEARVLLTSHAYDAEIETAHLDGGFYGTILYLEDLAGGTCDEELLGQIRRHALDTDPLYCNFTSGSTGTPKGVAVAHRSVIDFIGYFTEIFGISDQDIIGNQAPFDFDVSVKDIYSGLLTGATVQIIPTKYFSIPMQLLDFLTERHVTVLTWAVSALCLISQLHGFDYKIPSEVKKVLFSGEVMPVKQLIAWQDALPEAMFANLYGPTEITCNCTYYIVDHKWNPGEVLPSGKPFPNERVFLLDENDSLITEHGRTGELCVAGTALALGYYNAPEQTAKAFVRNPLNTKYPELIYRTGDLAYYNEKGEFCFASRRDFQIKHMGHRIELGEIDASFDAVPEIERACCIYENNKIIAFYSGNIERRELSQALARTLPSFMIPNVFIRKETFPLTKNGKIDRKVLLEEYQGRNGSR